MKFNCNYIKQINNKKFVLCFLLILISLISSLLTLNVVRADNDSSDEIEQNLTTIIDQIVDGVNLDDLDDILSNLNSLTIFDGSVSDKIKDILNGEYFSNYASVFSGILSLLLVDFREFLPFLFTILAIGVLGSLIKEFGSDNSSTCDIIHFVCFSLMTIVILYVFKDVLNVTSKAFNLILNQIQIVFPILITLLSTIGSFSTISIYNPMVAVLTSIVSILFDKILYPMFIILFVLNVLGGLTETVKLNKFQGFLSSVFKWSVGIVFTLFTGFLSLQGISAGKFDSVSIKATKFAVKSYIPIIGSYISDGMDFIVLGSVLVKNTIGLVGILILFLSIVSPIITMVVLKLGLQLCAAVLDLCGSEKMANFVSNTSKILIYPIVLILGVAFMYTITIALIMCTANIF